MPERTAIGWLSLQHIAAGIHANSLAGALCRHSLTRWAGPNAGIRNPFLGTQCGARRGPPQGRVFSGRGQCGAGRGPPQGRVFSGQGPMRGRPGPTPGSRLLRAGAQCGAGPGVASSQGIPELDQDLDAPVVQILVFACGRHTHGDPRHNVSSAGVTSKNRITCHVPMRISPALLNSVYPRPAARGERPA